MTFDMIFMILCLFLGGYGIYTGIRLKQGYDMPITGYTAMPEEDKRYYDDQKVKKYAAIMNIAAGCGLEVVDVNRLLKQYEMMQALTKSLSSGKLPRGFGGIPGLGGGGGRMHGFGRRKRLR